MLEGIRNKSSKNIKEEREFLMRQLFLEKGRTLLQDVSVPLVGDGEILVKVHYSFISTGTELATVASSSNSLLKKATSNFTKNINKVVAAVKENGITATTSLIRSKLNQLLPLGYSCSGRIISIGKNVETFKVGDYVACAGAGIANHAEVVVVPQNLAIKITNSSFLRQASLTTIGAVALQGIRRADLHLGEKVCVIGLGLIGQITVQLAKLCGCRVLGVDLRQDRLDLAKKLGCDQLFNSAVSEFINDINFASSHFGIDTTIITAASSSGHILQQAMEVTRRKGKVVLVGDVKLDFNREPFYSKEIDLLISCSYGPGRYDDSYEKEGKDYPYPYVRWTENRNMQLFMDLVQKGSISVDPLISAEFEFEKVNKAYDALKKSGALGVVLSYKSDLDFSKDVSHLLDKVSKDLKLDALVSQVSQKYTPPSGNLRVGIIGVGGFAKLRLLPIINSFRKIELRTIVDTDFTNSINVAKQYNAKYFTNDYRKLLVDDEIDVVIIATPHRHHAQQSIKLLRAGKAVFVEKPAVVNFVQLEQLKEFFVVNKNALYCVDFNRSFAPFNLAIKKEITKRTSPIMINYRINAGFIPKTHWIQSQRDGGRIIGEACHIFELFSFLTDAKPVLVSVGALSPNREDLLSTDNFSAQICMDDGSCCSLIYSAVGNFAMGKERMEIFFDGKSIEMDDYLILKGYGFSTAFNQSMRFADKGHSHLISKFIQAAREKDYVSPIPFERIAIATEISLIVDKLVREGGGSEKILLSNFK